jgi:CRISPR-associated protein Csm3
MQLEKFIKITGIIRWSGGRVGGQKELVEIASATENPIIRHPITGIPYIPGSSFKGKIRSLLELSTEKGRIANIENEIIQHKSKEPPTTNKRDHEQWSKRLDNLQRYKRAIEEGEPCGCGLDSCLICKGFGPHKNVEHYLGPTRFIFRDAPMASQKDIKDLQSLPENSFTLEEIRKLSQEKGLPFAEIKSENIINRHTGRASDPRSMERVIDGSLFAVEIIIRIFEQDNKKDILDLLKKGINLLEEDYLGGSGSRGYGKVKFFEMKKDEQVWTDFRQ